VGIGIKGYGVYVPYYRIKVEEIIETWRNSNIPYMHYVHKLRERAVCDFDEDVITMAVEASKRALKSAKTSSDELSALILGSHTSPYVMKASSTVIMDSLKVSNNAIVGDVQFSSKSGTLAVQLCSALANQTNQPALAIASDNVSIHTEPGDTFEYPASAGAAAFLVGQDNLIAEIEDFSTYNSDTPDMYRLEGDRYVTLGGDAMQTELGMPSHVGAAVQSLMAKLNNKPKDFDYAVFHQTFGASPFMIGTALGFNESQIAPGVLAEHLGDTGSASALIGLARILDQAKAGQRILVASYGPGAGSDAIAMKVTDKINSVRGRTHTVNEIMEEKQYINYATYAKIERKFHRKGGE
jgi:2-acetylphloroglucinol acetyltransferase